MHANVYSNIINNMVTVCNGLNKGMDPHLFLKGSRPGPYS